MLMRPSSLPRRSSSSSSLIIFYFFSAVLITLTRAQNTYQGCYELDNTLVQNDTSIYQSTGRCSGEICAPKKFAVFGLTSGSQCWCGNSLPKNQVTSDHCDLPCPGYPNDTCGGPGFINVWLTGVGKLQGSAATNILSAKPTSTNGGPSNTVTIIAGQTTITEAPSQSGKSSNGGLSGGAAAGIAITVLVIVGGAAGAFFIIRRRRRNEYQKQEGSNFRSSGNTFGTDQRLEPGMVQRRVSVGSLADEQDYSRKILRVTNPDGRD